jgi:hypothetical protein
MGKRDERRVVPGPRGKSKINHNGAFSSPGFKFIWLPPKKIILYHQNLLLQSRNQDFRKRQKDPRPRNIDMIASDAIGRKATIHVLQQVVVSIVTGELAEPNSRRNQYYKHENGSNLYKLSTFGIGPYNVPFYSNKKKRQRTKLRILHGLQGTQSKVRKGLLCIVQNAPSHWYANMSTFRKI